MRTCMRPGLMTPRVFILPGTLTSGMEDISLLPLWACPPSLMKFLSLVLFLVVWEVSVLLEEQALTWWRLILLFKELSGKNDEILNTIQDHSVIHCHVFSDVIDSHLSVQGAIR